MEFASANTGEACPAEILTRACADGFSEAKTFRRRAYRAGFAPSAPSECASSPGRLANINIDSILAACGINATLARRRADVGRPDLSDGAAVAACPDTLWGNEEAVKGEFSVDRAPKVVSWSPTIGTKVGYEDPPAQKRICGHGDPTDHPDYGLLVAQANFSSP